MPTDENAKVYELLKKFDTAMMVTRMHDGETRSRPMAIADVDSAGSIWFITSNTSGKISEIDRDPRVTLTMQSGSEFLSVTGHARFNEDPAKIAELWKEAYKTWFPKGKDDPAICLVHVLMEEAEYWDNAGINKVKFLIGAAKALLTGTKQESNGKDQHGRVRL